MENIRNESLTEKNYPFSVADINIPHSLRRSIWLIKDSEDGNDYTADEILDDKPQDIIFNMRSTLTAAYKSGIHKYTCPFCSQPLGLKVRTNEGDFFPFFSHYQDSDDSCVVKTTYEIDPTRIIISSENRFKESFLHRDMLLKLKEILELSRNFKEIETDKVISVPEITGYRRPSLYSVYQDRHQVCFDILVNNPQIGLLVGRNAFYKTQKMFYLWVFPDFSIRHQRMSEKDILYMNRRNVFVFDSSEYYDNEANKDYLKGVKHRDGYKYAYEESLRQKRLMLNCYWQTPVVGDQGEVKIKWEGPELVAFDDLIFNEDSYEIYFRDSDKDFYQTYSPQKQAIIDKWMRIKEDRWKNIFDSIEKRKRLYEQTLARREKRERLSYYYPLIESGEVVPIPYQDEKTKLWGYKVNDLEVIAPTYYDAKPFYQGYAWVRKSSYWGIIDYKGNRVLNFVYKDIERLSESLHKGRRKDHWELIDYTGAILGSFDTIEGLVKNKIKASKNGKCGYINERGEPVIPFEFDTIEEFVEGKARAEKDWKWGYINERGEELYDHKTLSNGFIVYSSSFKSRCGLMNETEERITGLDYYTIEDFFNGRAKAKKDSKWGCINERGETLIPFEFDAIGDFVSGRAKARKNCQWGYIDEEGITIIPFEYDEIGDLVNGNIKANKKKGWQKNGWGIINEKGEIIIPLEHEDVGIFTNGIVKVKKDGKWGFVNEKGEVMIPFKYDSAGDFADNGMAAVATTPISTCYDYWHYRLVKNKWGYINKKGETVIPFEFDDANIFINGKAKAKKNGRWGYIDENGNEIIQHKVLLNGLKVYLTSFENKIGLEDVNEKMITGLDYEAMGSFADKMAKAKTNDKWGVINEKGETIIPFEFEALGRISDGLAKAKSNSKWGCINEKGETIIPFNYDDIEYSEGKYKLFKVFGYGWRERKKIVKIIDPANPNKTIDLSKVDRNQIYTANITGFHKIGMFIKIPEIGSALVPANQFKQTGKSMNEYKKGFEVRVQLLDINEEKQQASFKFANEQI
ncbi:MAG: WG repeat-containing protein [Bacteroidales bacterium]|nr:WG repeat-containing protein [Bacteroidales bacterium]